MSDQNRGSTTTKDAADAKSREGQTGTSNKGASDQMKALEKEQNAANKPSGTPPPKKD